MVKRAERRTALPADDRVNARPDHQAHGSDINRGRGCATIAPFEMTKVPTERTVTVAVGHGKQAARNIHASLRGGAYAPKPELTAFERLETWSYTDADKTLQPVLAIIRRRTTFEEIHGGLDETNALFEARRCLSCGNCFECDNCYGVCPDNAVIKLGPGKRFEFNYDFRKGCGLCAAECPCGAIKMVLETI